MKQYINPKIWILPYGLVMGILLALLTFNKHLTGKQFESSFLDTILGILIITFLIAYPVFKYHLKEGIFSVRTALKIGLGVTAVGAIVNVIYMFCYANYIYPEYADKVTQIQVDAMRAMTDELSEAEFLERYNTLRKLILPYLYAGIIGMHLFFGFLVSFIMGAILKQQSK